LPGQKSPKNLEEKRKGREDRGIASLAVLDALFRTGMTKRGEQSKDVNYKTEKMGG